MAPLLLRLPFTITFWGIDCDILLPTFTAAPISLPPPLQVMRANRSLETLVLRDNPLGHTAARRLMRALQRRPGDGALKQVWGRRVSGWDPEEADQLPPWPMGLT